MDSNDEEFADADDVTALTALNARIQYVESDFTRDDEHKLHARIDRLEKDLFQPNVPGDVAAAI